MGIIRVTRWVIGVVDLSSTVSPPGQSEFVSAFLPL